MMGGADMALAGMAAIATAAALSVALMVPLARHPVIVPIAPARTVRLARVLQLLSLVALAYLMGVIIAGNWSWL